MRRKNTVIESNWNARTGGRVRGGGVRGRGGMTLVETMVAFGIFAIVATGVVGGLTQAHKMSLSNLAQSYAYSTAQAIIEEIIRIPPPRLLDTDMPSVEIKLARLTDENFTAIEDFTLPWAANDTTFTPIGTTAAGVLTDAAYLAGTNEIRPERFMLMRVNLRRTIEADQNRVRIVLKYQWEVPNRRNLDGTPIFASGELRTLRSTALRF